ncbi:MAG: sigma-70 family RNA polymerase sigma factor, partial [Oscillospiraceae bacterium]
MIKKIISIIKEYFEKLYICVKLPDYIFYISGSQSLPAPLTQEEEKIVFAGLEEGRQSCKDMLITHNLRLVVYIAKKFESSGIPIEDIISIGTIGLIKAVNTFSPSKNIKLATYASRCIENEILMYLRKSSNRRQESSIDEPLNVDCDGNELLLSDVLGTDQNQVSIELEQVAERDTLLEAVNKLSGREREIMQLRFGLGDKQEHTQKEVADI